MSESNTATEHASGAELVWCGPAVHPEVTPILDWCRVRFAIHWRRGVDELLKIPLPTATHVLVERLDRQELSADILNRVRSSFLQSQLATLEGKLCAGTGRSGPCWPHFKRIPWTATPAELEEWASASISVKSASNSAVALFAARPAELAWLSESLARLNVAAVTCNSHQHAYTQGMAGWLWDESAVIQLGMERWQAIVSQATTVPKHFLLTTFPTWNLRSEIAKIKVEMIAKPFDPCHLVKLLAV